MHSAQIIRYSSDQSLSYGRQLHVFQNEDHKYWLKSQSEDGHPQYVESFARELGFYQYIKQHPLILNHQIMDASHFPSLKQQGNVLVIDHAEPAFTDISAMHHNDISQKIKWIIQGLHEFHRLGTIHGDLKMGHFRQQQDQIKLIDFEQIQQIAQLQPMVLNATPRYMAPELFQGKSKTIQSDIYALGIILFEWLDGRKLATRSYQDWAFFHCQTAHLQLPEKFKYLQPCLNTMTAKSIEQRCGTLETLLELL
ncbi:MAG: serine/threonine-protein kinase [Acinetobacter sp.]